MERPRESGIERLRTGILAMMREMDLSLGDRLPTEKVMAERFKVSRPTLREALKLLEQEAVIDVQQGRGRFVAAGAALSIARPITKFESVSELVRSHGYRAQTHLLSFATVSAPPEIADKLAVPAGSPLFKVERLRKSAGQPLIYSMDWIPKGLAEALSENDTDWNGSIVELLARIDKAPVASTASVSAVDLPEETIRLHGLDSFGPALLIEEVCISSDGTRVIFARDYHKGSAFSFSFVRR